MRWFINILVYMASILIPVNVANACSFAPIYDTKDQHISDMSEIFYGRAVQTIIDHKEPPSSSQRLLTTFDIIYSWKGSPAKQTAVFHANPANSMCYGILFTQGENYLIFANPTQDGRLVTGWVDGTEAVSKSMFDQSIEANKGHPTQQIKSLYRSPPTVSNIYSKKIFSQDFLSNNK